MSTESEISVSSLIERLITIPLFASFTSTRPDPDHEPNRILLINPLTQNMVVIGTNGNSFESLVNDVTKPGQPPASESSIDGLPSREIRCREEIESGGECVICLEEWKVGDVASEMPCQHGFHEGCLKKWLKIHGSCPVCRFKMPVDDDDGGDKKVEGESGRGRGRGDVWVTFAFRGRSLNDDSSLMES